MTWVSVVPESIVYIQLQKELESLKKRAEEILKENQRLRMSGGIGLQANGTEW